MEGKASIWVLVALSALIRPVLALADVSSASDWNLIRSVHGEIGATITGNGYTLTQSMGEPVISLAPMVNGTTRTLGGYLSQVPSFSNSGTSVTTTIGSSTTVAMGGVVYGFKPADSLIVAFNNEMSSATLPGAITVTAVQDSMGNTVSSNLAYDLMYSATEQAAYVTLAAGWPKGTTYRLTVSTDAQEINGGSILTFSTVNFATARDFTAPNIVVAPAEPAAKVEVPPNAFTEDFTLVMSTGVDNQTIRTANESLVTTLGAARRPFKTAQIDAYGSAMERWTSLLAQDASIIIPFDDANSDGKVDNTSPSIRSRTLSMWRLDEDPKLWVRQGRSFPDLASKRVVLPTTHFSIYALVGSADTDVSLSYAFPVPFRPGVNNPDRYGTWADGIRFTNLPSEGLIRIFTVSGELVREMPVSDNPQRWDVKNQAGEVVASGVYIWEVSSGSNRKTGKLMVIK